jgi:four helix bundle protein
MGFEKLRVYAAAELLAARVVELAPRVPRWRDGDAKQLMNAAASVQYNIAEAYGLGRPEGKTQGRKIYHLEVARGSADETRSILRRLTHDKVFSPEQAKPLMILALTIAKMLTQLISMLRTTEPQ